MDAVREAVCVKSEPLQHPAEAALSILAAASVCQRSVFRTSARNSTFALDWPGSVLMRNIQLGRSVPVYRYLPGGGGEAVSDLLFQTDLVDSVRCCFPAPSAVATAWTRMYRDRADKRPHLSARLRALTELNIFAKGLSY